MSTLNLYRYLRKCARCGISKENSPGVTLLKCKACGVDFYCGKECQKADWPSHKGRCKTNREAQQSQGAQALTRWTRMHRPSIHLLASQELGIFDDPGKGANTVFIVHVRPRLQEVLDERKFEIIAAMPFPIAATMNLAPQIRQLYATTHASNSQINRGSYIIVILSEEYSPVCQAMGFDLGFNMVTGVSSADTINLINSGRLL